MTRCRMGLPVTLAFSLFVALWAAEAQAPGNVARVGYLSAAVPDCSASPLCQAMAQRLQELGYIEGQNVRLEFRTAAGQAERLPDLAAELGRLPVDVLVAAGPEATLRAAGHAARTIPIVMIAVDYDPMALGYIAGLPQPGGNITGVVLQQLELTGKRLELLQAALPQLRRVAVLWDAPSADQWRAATVPIVMVASVDAVGEGLVASLARPGGNVTGLSFLGTELPGKRLELLKEAVPRSTRIAVLANPAFPAYGSRLHNLTGAARTLGLHLDVVEVRRADELDTAFAAMTRAGADAVIVIEDAALLNSERGRGLAELAATHRLPVMYAWREWVVAGCLMSYGPSRPGMYRQAASYVDKLLKGANPAELPVEQATTFELVLNLTTAEALGLTIPPSLLFQATEVIR